MERGLATAVGLLDSVSVGVPTLLAGPLFA
jgi:hypothetical protein